MTMTDALELFLTGPAPYSSGNPVPSYQTAQQDLAAALEGQAPHFSKTIADRLGPATTAELAKVIRRAVAVGIRRRADQATAARLESVYDMLASGLNQIAPDCGTPEAGCACAVLNDAGDCLACGERWETISDQQECERCFDSVMTLSSRGLCDGCEAEAARRGEG